MLRTISTIILLMLITACSSTSIKSTSIESNKPLSPNSGIIAVQIVNNTDQLARWHQKWTEVIIFRSDNFDEIKQKAIEKAKAKHKGTKPFDPNKVEWDPEYYTLTPHSQGVLDSQIFLGTVPEGEYMISTLYSYYNGGDFSSWISMPVLGSAGSFKVEQKKLTNLGSVVFQPLLNIKENNFWSNRSSFKAYVTKVNQQQDLKAFILEHYPNLANQLDLTTELNWIADSFETFRTELSELSKHNAYGATGAYLSEHGKNIILSKLGNVRVQDSDGQWKTINLNTNSQLASVIELKGELAIGGELGQVFVGHPSKPNWTVHKPISAKEAIVWFGSNGTTHYAATQSASQFQVYTFTDVTKDWTKFGTFKRKSSGVWVQNGGLFPFIDDQGNLSVINDNSRYVYDNSTKKWSKLKSPSLVSMAQLQNGALVAVDVSQWDGIGDQIVSRDYGKSWQTVKRPLYKGSSVEGTMPIIMGDKVISVGRKKSKRKTELYELSIVSADAENISKSKTWSFHHPIKETCTTLLPNLSQRETIYMLCDQGEVVASNDLGKNWEIVLPLDLEKMQNTYELLLKKQKESKTVN